MGQLPLTRDVKVMARVPPSEVMTGPLEVMGHLPFTGDARLWRTCLAPALSGDGAACHALALTGTGHWQHN